MQSLALLLVLPDNAVWLYLSVRLCIETYYHRYVTTWLGAVITVGTDGWLPDLVERAKALKIGNGFQEGVDLGPVISPQSKAKIESLIAKGGKILLDGRNPKAPEGYPDGNWVAPTIIEVEPGDEAYDLEIFGPVLCVVKRDSLEDAIKVINSNRCMFIIDISVFWKLRCLFLCSFFFSQMETVQLYLHKVELLLENLRRRSKQASSVRTETLMLLDVPI
jgi:hypothetical protein